MNIKLKIISAKEFEKNFKCSIHKNGKLGFSETAIRKLNIDKNCGLIFGQNEDDLNDKNLYMKITREQIEDAFKINKAGQYFYANTKALFDSLELDYQNKTIIYDMLELNNDNEKLYKLIKREVEKKIK
jgi:hypothetical protein